MELYGKEMPPINAEDCNLRIETLNERLTELLSVDMLEQDTATINNVLAGIKFWNKLKDGEENEIYY